MGNDPQNLGEVGTSIAGLDPPEEISQEEKNRMDNIMSMIKRGGEGENIPPREMQARPSPRNLPRVASDGKTIYPAQFIHNPTPPEPVVNPIDEQERLAQEQLREYRELRAQEIQQEKEKPAPQDIITSRFQHVYQRLLLELSKAPKTIVTMSLADDLQRVGVVKWNTIPYENRVKTVDDVIAFVSQNERWVGHACIQLQGLGTKSIPKLMRTIWVMAFFTLMLSKMGTKSWEPTYLTAT